MNDKTNVTDFPKPEDIVGEGNKWPDAMQEAIDEIFSTEDGTVPGPSMLKLMLAMFEELNLVRLSVEEDDYAELGRRLKECLQDDLTILAMIHGFIAMGKKLDDQEK